MTNRNIRSASIDLQFSSRTCPRLDRVEFTSPFSSTTHVSLRKGVSKRAVSSEGFRWTRAVRALCILFLRTASNKEPVCAGSSRELLSLSGAQGSLAHALVAAINKNEPWLVQMFGMTAAGKPACGEILRVTRSSARTSKSLSIYLGKSTISAADISISLDGKALQKSDDLLTLADTIENEWDARRLFLCDKAGQTPMAPIVSPLSSEPMAEQMRETLVQIPRTLVTNLHSATAEPSAMESLQKIFSKVGGATQQGVLVQLSQQVEIDIQNQDGDGQVRYLFDVANFGLEPFANRQHIFWFDRPQGSLEFRCYDGNLNLMPIEVTETTPHQRETRVIFQNPIQPAERRRYEIHFDVKGAFPLKHRYSLFSRTLTNLLGLTVKMAEGMDVGEVYVTHETADGYLRDDPPLLMISREANRQKIHWQVKNPKPGEFFRTFWSFPKTDVASESDSAKSIGETLRPAG